MIKEARWFGWVWVGESSFWYRPTRVVPDQRPLNGRCCCCCCCYSIFPFTCLDLGHCYCLTLYILFLIHFNICIYFTSFRCSLSTRTKVLIDWLIDWLIGWLIVQTGSSYGTHCHPRPLWMVPFDRRKIFLCFLPPELYAYLASFWSYGVKNEIAENKNWLLWQLSLRDWKSRFR